MINTTVSLEGLLWKELESEQLKEAMGDYDFTNVIPIPFKKKNSASNFASVPEEMKQHDCWVCWSREERNGRTTKVPKNPKTGGNASTTLSGTWGSFVQAETYYAEHTDVIDGIGYVFAESNGVVGIDFDHCVEDGKIISEEIQELVNRCGSYVELSPSGTGLHMYVRGKWKEPGGRKNNKLGGGIAIEVYPSARFFTVTGEVYSEARPLSEQQELLDEIYVRYFAEPKEAEALVPARLEDLDVEPEYVKRLETKLENRNGWLSLLWQGHHTKESESEADMALICRLLKICDGDEEAVKKLFMASPFAMNKDSEHRKKLNRDDYWRASIDNAMDYLEQHPEFEKHDRFRPLLRFDGDNDGYASMLYEYMEGNILYCPEEREWLVCDNGCWNRDPDAHLVRSKLIKMNKGLKATVDAIISEKRDTIDEDEIKKTEARLKKKIGSLGNSGGIDGTIRYAKDWDYINISESQLDAHDDLLGAGNGIINLRTGELLPFDRQYYITRRTEINYNPDAPEPKEFLKYMNDTSCGIQEWVDYMQLVLGYCITGCTNQEAFFVFHGETGQNGKSTLLDTLCEMFPQHITTMNKVALSESKSNSELNSPLAQVKNYRMVITDENDGKHRLDEAMVRGIASGESPKVRDLFEKSDPNNTIHYKVVFCGNDVPKFNWRLNANMRRLCLIPFNNTIPNGKEDTHLREKLLKEKEGILAWIVAGAKRSFTESIKKRPPVVEEYTRKLMYEEDPIYGFCQDEVVQTDNPDDVIQAAQFFEAYNDWRELNDLPNIPYKENITAFGQRLKQLGYSKRYNGQKQVVYTGIQLRQENHSDVETEEDNKEKPVPDSPDIK